MTDIRTCWRDPSTQIIHAINLLDAHALGPGRYHAREMLPLACNFQILCSVLDCEQQGCNLSDCVLGVIDYGICPMGHAAGLTSIVDEIPFPYPDHPLDDVGMRILQDAGALS